MTGCKDCNQYEKELKELKDRYALMEYELKSLKSEFFKKSRKKKDIDKDQPKPLPKKKGALFGHIGWFRERRKKINRIVEVRLSKCPYCGGKDLTERQDTKDHYQEDIILPEAQATLFRKHRYYCNGCKKTIMGKDADEIPKSKIGPVAKSWATFLKYGIKISDRDVANILKMLGLKVVPSSIVGFRDQLKKESLPIYELLITSLKRGKFIHLDETGAKINGENAWCWKASNKTVCITHTARSRGQKVVEEILGPEYDGVLISDFLSAYNKIKTKAKQKCLVHILRDLKKVLEYWREEDDEVIRYCGRLKGIFEDAIKLYKEYLGKNWDRQYYTRRRQITESLKDFAFPNPDKKILNRFAKRLERYKGELFTFLYIKDIDYHNNHAEQQIRPDVLLRKITFGNRSDRGAKTHDVVMSVLQTARLNKMDPAAVFRKILLPFADNPFKGILSAPP